MTKNQILGKIVEEVDKEIKNNTSKQGWHFDEYTEGYLDALKNIKTFLDTLEVKEVREESVSKDLEEVAFDYAEACKYDGGEKLLCVEHFKAGAQWQKQQNALGIKAAQKGE